MENRGGGESMASWAQMPYATWEKKKNQCVEKIKSKAVTLSKRLKNDPTKRRQEEEAWVKLQLITEIVRNQSLKRQVHE